MCAPLKTQIEVSIPCLTHDFPSNYLLQVVGSFSHSRTLDYLGIRANDSPTSDWKLFPRENLESRKTAVRRGRHNFQNFGHRSHGAQRSLQHFTWTSRLHNLLDLHHDIARQVTTISQQSVEVDKSYYRVPSSAIWFRSYNLLSWIICRLTASFSSVSSWDIIGTTATFSDAVTTSPNSLPCQVVHTTLGPCQCNRYLPPQGWWLSSQHQDRKIE